MSEPLIDQDVNVTIPRTQPPHINLYDKHSMICPDRLSVIEKRLAEVFAVIDNADAYDLGNELIDRLNAATEIVSVSVVPESVAGFTCFTTSGYWVQYKVNGYFVTLAFVEP
eukprot:TRINITY_DN57577_c0_g1_i1.p2 TRINITY_DN57577_c0_g1~~TRINITY_DN57577_c0_g1_i1.p2  ORF type:complete len:112 (+),score=13.88 TRINITY_DN57577_c0_g1_i1:126-461(+)